jgi:hypothetical protein
MKIHPSLLEVRNFNGSRNFRVSNPVFSTFRVSEGENVRESFKPLPYFGQADTGFLKFPDCLTQVSFERNLFLSNVFLDKVLVVGTQYNGSEIPLRPYYKVVNRDRL